MSTTNKAFSPAWMKAQIHATGKKQKDLVAYLQAKGLDVDATKISRSVNGGRAVQPEEMPHVWEFFGADPTGLAEAIKETGSAGALSVERQSAMPNVGLPEKIKFDPIHMPILGVSVGGQGQSRALFNGERLGLVSRPTSLANNRKAYAAYVHGDSMEPRYEAGELVLVNPDKPYRQGNYVVAQIFDNEGDPPFGYVKRFISYGSELVLEQLNPPKDEDKFMRFPKSRVLSVHRIVGTLDE